MNNTNNSSGQNELRTSEWFGAIIRYLFFLGTKEFDTLYAEDQILKNALVGWIFKIILLIGFIYLALWYASSN